MTTNASGPDTSDRRRATEEAERLARYRLIIEGGPDAGFVYKNVDRLTGEIVSQYPREEVLKLKSDPAYSGGKVIDTTA
ncbi:hypothetical protein [Brevundimonas sp.]|uniref:hypothetical protein n=1 Tax=Brevundimonas sp. TaxID=1871086 RepID=UPI0025E9AA39|nr:hypothetical protein [Brevundimonas sp.]